MPIPYLTFHGDCAEAFDTYAQVFGGTVSARMYPADLPGFTAPEGKEQWVLHSELTVPGGAVYGSDDMMGDTPPMAGCSISMDFPDVDAARAAFDVLAEDGRIRMSFQKTEWTPGFGTLTDRWGIQWMIQVGGDA